MSLYIFMGDLKALMTFAIVGYFAKRIWATKSFIICTVELDGARNMVWGFAIMLTRTLSMVIISSDSETSEFLLSCLICADLGDPILNDANNKNKILKYFGNYSYIYVYIYIYIYIYIYSSNIW